MFILVLCFSCTPVTDPLPEEEESFEAPLAATLIFPEDNTECQEGTVLNNTQSRVPFRWNTSEHTDSYEVRLENLDDGIQSTHESDTNGLEIVIERGTAYRWSVVSKSEVTDETALSAVWTFYNAGEGIVNYAPFPADLIHPANLQTLVASSESVLLQWEASDIDGDIVSYEVFLDTLNPPITSLGTTSAAQMRADVTSNTTYYWSVQVTDSAYNSSKSTVFSFTTE